MKTRDFFAVPIAVAFPATATAAVQPQNDMEALRCLLHDLQSADADDHVQTLAMRLEAIIGPGEANPDAELVSLADRHDAILALTPENPSDEVSDRITDEAAEVLREMFDRRASTFSGVRAKMRWLRDCPITFGGDDLDARMMRSIARDTGLGQHA